MTCRIEGCSKAVRARQLCGAHYEHNRQYGRPEKRTPRERFDAQIDRNGPAFEDNGRCWLWTGVTTHGGYAQMSIDDMHRYAHRLSYEWSVGPIPEGMQIDHLCRVRRCVNPAHLEVVTPMENTRRAARLVTHCPSGHPYDEANTHIRNGRRKCRACDRARWHRKQKREAA